MKIAKLLLPFLIILASFLKTEAEDSLRIFPFKDFYDIILNHHPVVRQAQLLNETAFKELRVARGSFDPKLDFDFTRKVFKGTTYYDYIDFGLKVPMWFGADIKAGFEQNSGLFVNPTNFTPPEGLGYIGFDFPIGQGMVIDERRALVKQARIASQISEMERIKIINKILLNASKDYWEWYYQYHRMKQMEYAYKIGEIRYTGIKERVIQGDLASIDSTEAYIIVQERWLEFQKALNDYQNCETMLSNYLWTDDVEPLQIYNMIPEEPSASILNDSTLKNLNVYAQEFHPELVKLNYKITQQKIDKNLKFNNLLPGLSIGAKYLNTPGGNLANDLNFNYTANNYRIMVSLSQPLFIRKEIGKYQLSKIKINQTQYDQKITNREITNSIAAAYNDVQTYKELIKFQENVYSNTKTLFNGEKAKFENGESTLFLVNSRETKMVESNVKVFELKAKLEKSIAHLYWSAGKYSYTD